MKKKLLILTRNPVAKVGIASYLSSLLGQYLTIVSTRIADLKPEDMEETDCILYSVSELKDQNAFSSSRFCKTAGMYAYLQPYLPSAHQLQIPLRALFVPDQ